MIHKIKWLIASLALLFGGMALAVGVQTEFGSIRHETFRLVTDTGNVLTGKMYIPSTATPQHPAPAVVTCSGGNNEYYMHESINTELARNGFVVVTFNPYRHGASTITETATMGAAEILKYTATLSFVDASRIGTEGHTLGGSYLAKAVAQLDTPVQAALFVNFVSIDNSLQGYRVDTPVNLAWVMASYDEYTIKPATLPQNSELKTLFGTDQPIEAGVGYGDTSAKTSRVLYMMPVTNAGYIFHKEVLSQITNYFNQMLQGEDATLASQIFPWVQMYKLVAFVGFIGLLFSLWALLATAPLFACVVHKPSKQVQQKEPHKACILLSPILIALPFIPLYMLGKRVLPYTAIFPQSDSNGLAIWAIFVGCILLLTVLASHRKNGGMDALIADTGKGIASSFLLAAIVVATGYLINMLLQWLFCDHITLGFTTLSFLSPRRALAMLSYLPVYLICFLSSNMFAAQFLCASTSMKKNIIRCIWFYTAGFVALIALNFTGFLWQGQALFHWGRFAFAPILYMLPMLPVLGAFTAWCYQKTQRIYVGSFLCTLLFSWLFVATNAFYL